MEKRKQGWVNVFFISVKPRRLSIAYMYSVVPFILEVFLQSWA